MNELSLDLQHYWVRLDGYNGQSYEDPIYCPLRLVDACHLDASGGDCHKLRLVVCDFHNAGARHEHFGFKATIVKDFAVTGHPLCPYHWYRAGDMFFPSCSITEVTYDPELNRYEVNGYYVAEPLKPYGGTISGKDIVKESN